MNIKELKNICSLFSNKKRNKLLMIFDDNDILSNCEITISNELEEIIECFPEKSFCFTTNKTRIILQTLKEK